MIYREHYINPIREFYDSDLIKMITGIRRCGKSVILEQIKEEIGKKSKNIVELNFEDRRIISNIPDANSLIEYIDTHKNKESKCYIFLDEVQNVRDWQEVCKTLRLDNNSLFITGSNSKLLSKEFTKELSGRYVSFRIRPFIYKEIKEYCKELKKEECTISDYLIWGGFPKRFEFNTIEAQKRYLEDLDDTIVINNLINRYKIQKPQLFTNILNFVLRSNSRIVSANSITNYLKSNNIEGSINTVINYLGYLEEAYVINKIKPYSSKTKTELEYYFKIYDEDVAFNSIRCMDNRFDLTHNLENIVYNELIYMGYNVLVFSENGKKVDFLAEIGNKKYYIQVAYSIAEPKTYDREFAVFNTMDNSSQKIIITNDDIDYSTSTVRHIKLKDFLQMENLGS